MSYEQFYNREIEEMQEMEWREMERELEEELKEDDLLNTRATTHGEFTENAEFVQNMKAKMMDETTSYWALEAYQKEALDMIAHKIARILYGDGKFIDSWRDIKGYTQLVIDRLEVDPDATDVRNVKTELLDGKWVDLC